MSTTFFLENPLTVTQGGTQAQPRCPDELFDRYKTLVDDQRMSWTEHLRLIRLLGSGGQGVVYLSQRRGADGFTLPVALKIFSPERYEDSRSYDDAMARIADVAARVSQIQQDNLLDVHNFVDRNRIRLMEMEWIDGYDLSQLLTPDMLARIKGRVSEKRWTYLNNVIITAGAQQPRIKAGIAVNIVRECLAALAALHRDGIVHGDIKPSNIMLKRTGNAKIVDIASAFALDAVPPMRTCTPPMPHRKFWKDMNARRGPTSRALAMCSSKCSPVARRSPAWAGIVSCSKQNAICRSGLRKSCPRKLAGTNC